jgi:hypothetical protein
MSLTPPSQTEISKDDYFIKAAEFRVWLHEKKNKYLDELKSDDARYYFGKFVKAWNRFELDRKQPTFGISTFPLSNKFLTICLPSYRKIL